MSLFSEPINNIGIDFTVSKNDRIDEVRNDFLFSRDEKLTQLATCLCTAQVCTLHLQGVSLQRKRFSNFVSLLVSKLNWRESLI